MTIQSLSAMSQSAVRFAHSGMMGSGYYAPEATATYYQGRPVRGDAPPQPWTANPYGAYTRAIPADTLQALSGVHPAQIRHDNGPAINPVNAIPQRDLPSLKTVQRHLETFLDTMEFDQWVKAWHPNGAQFIELITFPGEEAQANLMATLKQISADPKFKDVARDLGRSSNIPYNRSSNSFNFLGRPVIVAEHEAGQTQPRTATMGCMGL